MKSTHDSGHRQLNCSRKLTKVLARPGRRSLRHHLARLRSIQFFRTSRRWRTARARRSSSSTTRAATYVYRCKHCRTHLALTDDIISKVRHVVSFLNLAPSPRAPSYYVISDWPWCFGFFQDFLCHNGKAYLFDKV